MSEVENNYKQKEEWYNKYIFPLVPIIRKRSGDKYNTSSFYFKWLFFSFWTLDFFSFEISLVADTHWGIGFTALLPYSRVIICLPCPIGLGFKIDELLKRKPKTSEYEQ